MIADAVAPALAAAYAVGRMGCFLNGDDYGKPSGLPWAMAFPKGDPPTTTLVHPTQLYEILASLAIFAILVWVLSPRLKRAGALMSGRICVWPDWRGSWWSSCAPTSRCSSGSLSSSGSAWS